MAHLMRRVREREISTAQLGLLARWLDADPEVPDGKWFKCFPEMIVCGEVSLVKAFLRPGQAPFGEEVLYVGFRPRSPSNENSSPKIWS